MSFIPLATPSTAAATASSTASAITATGASPTRASVTPTAVRLVKAASARGVDANGRPVGETAVFDRASDLRIVLVVQIAAGTRATTVGYRRYFDGVFVDGRNMNPTRDGDGIVTFSWVKSGGFLFPAGPYRVNLLLDGKPAGQVDFVVR